MRYRFMIVLFPMTYPTMVPWHSSVIALALLPLFLWFYGKLDKGGVLWWGWLRKGPGAGEGRLSCSLHDLWLTALQGLPRPSYVPWPPGEVLGKWSPFNLTLRHDQPQGPCWAQGTAVSFNVRAVGYGRTGKKAPSMPPLYEVVGADVMPGRLEGLADRPELVGLLAGSAPHPWTMPRGWSATIPALPWLVVLHIQVPLAEPSLLSPSPPDLCASILVYGVIAPLTLTPGAEQPRALALLRRLLQEGVSSREGTALKLIVLGENLEEMGLPPSLHKYSGKPVLLTRSCTLSTPAPGVVGITVDLGRWGYVARRTLHGVQGRLDQALLHFGLVVEGRVDEELPERVLLCCRLRRLKLDAGA